VPADDFFCHNTLLRREIRIAKSEIRNKSKYPIPKPETRVSGLGHWVFGFGYCFAIRISTFGFSPVFLEVDVPLYFRRRLVGMEAPLLEDLDHAGRPGVDALAGLAVLRRHADHLGVAAQVDVRPRRVQRGAQPLLELSAGDQILDVNLVLDRLG